MLKLFWPIALMVVSNVCYQVCAKSMPARIDPFAALTATYLTAALASGLAYAALHPGQAVWTEYRYLNWTPLVLGVAVVGLELGSIYMYKVGWNVSTGYLVQSALLAVALLALGALAYGEVITWTKALGVVVCIIGVVLLGK